MNSETFNRYLRQIKSSEEAFRKIYEYYLPKLKYRVVSRYGRQVDFEDVAHDLFMKLIRTEDPPYVENPTAWIYRICDNIAYDHIRRRNRDVSLDDYLTATLPGGEGVERSEEASDFFGVLSNLDKDDRELVAMVLWEGFSLKECAEMLGAGYGAVRQRYSRALKKLKKHL